MPKNVVSKALNIYNVHLISSTHLRDKMPNLYVIGGPNGAGKTTSAMFVLPDRLGCIEYVNADAIAAGLSPLQPELAALDGGKLMLERIKKLASNHVDFAFETTLASRFFAKFIKDCNKIGYTTTLLYMWLENVDLAINRVKFRVEQGGHSIPIDTIRRRYIRSIKNLFALYMPVVENCYVFDNSFETPREVVVKEGDKIDVTNTAKWDKMRAIYGQ